MSAYIVIVDTPYFATTGKRGRAALSAINAGKYALHVWYPEMAEAPPPVPLTLGATDSKELTVVIRK